MYILEFLVNSQKNEVIPRKLKRDGEEWYDADFDILVHEPGLYCIDVDNMKFDLVSRHNIGQFHNHIYFLVCKTKLGLDCAMLAYAIGRMAEEWKSKENVLRN